MRGVNKVIIVGNLGADPEVKQFQNGGSVTSISVATSEQWNDKQTGERRETTEWHRISLYNKLGEIAAQYLRKGSSVYIEGSLRTRKYQDPQGQERYITEIRADQMQMLNNNSMGSQARDNHNNDGLGYPNGFNNQNNHNMGNNNGGYNNSNAYQAPNANMGYGANSNNNQNAFANGNQGHSQPGGMGNNLFAQGGQSGFNNGGFTGNNNAASQATPAAGYPNQAASIPQQNNTAPASPATIKPGPVDDDIPF